MKPRNILSVAILIVIVTLIATTLRLAHLPPGMTEARAQTIARPPASDQDSITYYLLDAGELATIGGGSRLPEESDSYTAFRVAPQKVIAVVSSLRGESRLRSVVDDANRQVASYGGPVFRIVDLRPSMPMAGAGIEGS
jgi:hypothetical protein